MRLLLDTHALIWWMTEPEKLSATAFDILSDPDNEILVSALTAYEVAFKRPQSALLQRLPAAFEEAVRGQGFGWLAISSGDAMAAGALPRHHGDPWDRLLIAQSARLGAPVITIDRWFPAYGVHVVW